MTIVQPKFEIISPKTEADGSAILRAIEDAARTCYKSESGDFERTKKFVSSLVGNAHHAMLEFATATVRFTCDRGVSHELVRHRICSFAQESTRYCRYKDGIKAVYPSDFAADDELYEAWRENVLSSEAKYLKLLAAGVKPEIARSVLPTCLATEIVVMANLREWRHIFQLRCSPKAHPQMRELMIPLRAELAQRIPVVFDDLLPKEGEDA